MALLSSGVWEYSPSTSIFLPVYQCLVGGWELGVALSQSVVSAVNPPGMCQSRCPLLCRNVVGLHCDLKPRQNNLNSAEGS